MGSGTRPVQTQLLKKKKNAEFHTDFESVEKGLKKCTKKVISKNVSEICTFFTFTHVRQTCFAYNFFLVHFLTTFSTDSFFDTFFDFFRKQIFLGHISTFFKL